MGCGVFGETFLDALIIAARHKAKGLEEEQYTLDDEAKVRVTRECTIAAGGDTYHRFWNVLVGPDDPEE